MNKKVGVEVPHPGIDKYTPGEKRTYHKYYQWVCFVLFIQGLAFYAPRYIWEAWEGCRIESLVQSLNSPVIKKETQKEEVALLVEYFKANLRTHNNYFYRFVLCEVFYFFNVTGQMYLIDAFLGGAFSTYGFNVIRYTEQDQHKRTDPLITVFPRMTKCIYYLYGPSGDIEKYDTLCVLPLNILNEKIYLFFWFWFVALSLLTGATLAYRLLILFFATFRKIILNSRVRLYSAYYLNVVLKSCKVGDWFLLHMLSKNMDPVNFGLLIDGLGEEMLKERQKVNDEKDQFMVTSQELKNE